MEGEEEDGRTEEGEIEEQIEGTEKKEGKKDIKDMTW